MRKYYFSLPINLPLSAFTVLFFTLFTAGAQVGIGTTTPQAMLDVVASDPANPTAKDGFLMPRVTSLTQDFQATAVGTMVFYSGPTGVGHGNMKNTVYFFDGNNWKNMSGEIASTTDPKDLHEYDAVNKGVVFWIDPNDPYHYKIVAPLEFDLEYGSSNGDSDEGGLCTTHQCTYGVNGLEATKSWIDAHSTLIQSNYDNYAPSMAYYYDGDSEPGSTHDGWYLPGVGEMRVIGKNRNTIKSAFSGVTHDDISSDDYYWVSQDSKVKSNGDSEAVVLKIKVNNDDNLKVDGKKKEDQKKVRIVKEIGG